MSDSVENARKFLESLHRPDLSKLLAFSEVESGIGDAGDWFETYVIVRSPKPFSEALDALSPHDRKRIAEAVVSDEGNVTAPGNISIHTMLGPAIEGAQALLPELIIHQQMMIDVSTGNGPSIQDVNDYYMARQARLLAICAAQGVAYDNKHVDLWDWYGYWKENFAHWSERRQYVGGLFKAAIQAASGRTFSAVPEREPTGWERVDRTLARARAQLDVAANEEDYQAIGLLCREVMISLAQAVHDPAVHVPEDGVTPSATDANRMLEAYIRHVFPGDSYKEVRAHARAALALALNVQHRRTATRQLAALCLEAASSATAVVSIIAGRVG